MQQERMDLGGASSAHSLTEADLSASTGSEQWYSHPMDKRITFTDGVKLVAEKGGAFWLIDVIVSAQIIPSVRREEVQIWRLTVDLDKRPHRGVVECGDGNGDEGFERIVYRQVIPATDFPLAKVVMWLQNNVIYMPSES